jgi:hypothetical protein
MAFAATGGLQLMMKRCIYRLKSSTCEEELAHLQTALLGELFTTLTSS